MKHHSEKERPHLVLYGKLRSPLTIGKPVILDTAGALYHTSCVTAIQEQMEGRVQFDTLHAHYLVSQFPTPPIAPCEAGIESA